MKLSILIEETKHIKFFEALYNFIAIKCYLILNTNKQVTFVYGFTNKIIFGNIFLMHLLYINFSSYLKHDTLFLFLNGYEHYAIYRNTFLNY